MTETKIRPWVVGEEGVIVVGVEGVIQEIGDGTLTINGLTLPTRLGTGFGARYISMTWPEGDETTCSRDHCGPGCEKTSEEESLEDRVAEFALLAYARHYADHEGALRICPDQLCKLADEEHSA